MMKKPHTYYIIGISAITLVLIAGFLSLPKSLSVNQLNTVNSEAVTEKTEKISAGMPLWHAIPRFLFRRY